jgi:hypothetical protein
MFEKVITVTIIACAICQAPTKSNRLYEFNNQEVCVNCAHTNDHITNNKFSAHCKHCDAGVK